MLRRRVIHVLAFASILTAAAACSDMATAPADDPVKIGVPCSQPAPEPGMVCRADTWGWN